MTTRREIVKAGAGLAAILAAGKAPAALVRSLVAGRNALMTGGGGAELPFDSKVEYLESTGTQWIDTGVRPVNGIGARISFMITGFDPNLDPITFVNNGIMGAENDGWGGASFSVAGYSFDEIEYRIWSMVGNGESSYIDEAIQLGVRYSVGLNYQNSSLMQIDGRALATVSASDKADCALLTSNIFLFGVSANTGASDTALGICRIYEVVITNGFSVIAHYIPVRKDSVGYMYDQVTGRLFGNDGTGAFGYGNDI